MRRDQRECELCSVAWSHSTITIARIARMFPPAPLISRCRKSNNQRFVQCLIENMSRDWRLIDLNQLNPNPPRRYRSIRWSRPRPFGRTWITPAVIDSLGIVDHGIAGLG